MQHPKIKNANAAVAHSTNRAWDCAGTLAQPDCAFSSCIPQPYANAPFAATPNGSINYYVSEPLALTAFPSDMPVIGIGLEEHVQFETLRNELPASQQNLPGLTGLLMEVGQTRLAAMNASRNAIQVISWPGAGADCFTGNDAVSFATNVNNNISAAIKSSGYPERLRGFAHLPTLVPNAAAAELRRAVQDLGFVGALISGQQGGHFLDSPQFEPIFTAAEQLDVPLYLHPAPPPQAVDDAYYYTTDHLNASQARTLSTVGWGWHSEVGVHVLRLVYSGTFHRHPRLKIVIGHMGEMLPMMMQREDTLLPHLGLSEPVSTTLRKHVWVSFSGFFTLPPLMACIETFGVDRITFSSDYPFVSLAWEQGGDFQKYVRDVMSEDMVHAIYHKNAQTLLKIGVDSPTNSPTST